MTLNRLVSLIVVMAGCGDLSKPPPSAGPVEVSGIEAEGAEACGNCHPAHFEEWRQSMHAYAARSPVFEAMAAKTYRDTAGEVGTFCTGCHAVLGTMDGESATLGFEERSPISQEGVTCEVCHTAVSHNGPIGNANLSLDLGGALKGPFVDVSQDSHESEHGDYLTSAELCGTCHDVFAYPGIAIEEAYTEYLTSPAYADGQRCQDCHMSPEPGVSAERVLEPIAVTMEGSYPDRPRSSHRFIGPDYSLVDDFPFPEDPEAAAEARQEQLEQIEVLLKNAVRLDGIEGRIVGTTMTLEVALQSTTTGHNVPTGFTSERQLWLDVIVTDGQGDVVFRSGDLDRFGDLRDPHSWAVIDGSVERDEQLVNLQSKNLVVRRTYADNGQFNQSQPEISETVFPFDADTIEKHSLAPLERRVVSYEIPDVSGVHSVEVTLRYRNLPPYVLRALDIDALVDRLQVFALDADTASVE
jgi:nitrate/TMAO reductase-like tetraheme cytochrome c subunit